MFQLQLALDVEFALPHWMKRKLGCVVKYERIYPNRPASNRVLQVLQFLRRILEGPLNKEQLCDVILGRHTVSL